MCPSRHPCLSQKPLIDLSFERRFQRIHPVPQCTLLRFEFVECIRATRWPLSLRQAHLLVGPYFFCFAPVWPCLPHVYCMHVLPYVLCFVWLWLLFVFDLCFFLVWVKFSIAKSPKANPEAESSEKSLPYLNFVLRDWIVKNKTYIEWHIVIEVWFLGQGF